MALLEKNLVIKKSTLPGAGKGLFTKKIIPKGTRIVEYKGKVTTWKEVDHLDGLNAYIFYIDRNHVIDASLRKNELARYANDAVGFKKINPQANNCKYVEDNLRVFIESKRDIPPNTELFVRYGKKYWDTIQDNRKKSIRERKNIVTKKLRYRKILK